MKQVSRGKTPDLAALMGGGAPGGARR
jgi:hypothetical protein